MFSAVVQFNMATCAIAITLNNIALTLTIYKIIDYKSLNSLAMA